MAIDSMIRCLGIFGFIAVALTSIPGRANLVDYWYRGWSPDPVIVFPCNGQTVYFRQVLFWITLSGRHEEDFDAAFGEGAEGTTCSQAAYKKGPEACLGDESNDYEASMECLKKLHPDYPKDRETRKESSASGSVQ